MNQIIKQINKMMLVISASKEKERLGKVIEIRQ